MYLVKDSCLPMSNHETSKKKILIVDDDFALQNLIYRFLIYHDYQVEAG